MGSIQLQIWAAAAVVAALCIIVAVAVVASRRRKRTQQLQVMFGPEYDRAIRLYGDRTKAEAALENRRKRLNEISLRDLSEAERDRLSRKWQEIRASGSSDPAGILIRAEELVKEVLQLEGFPQADPEERMSDFSMVHPDVAEAYRKASEILKRHYSGLATGAEYREGEILYSRIFSEMLGKPHADNRLRKVS